MPFQSNLNDMKTAFMSLDPNFLYLCILGVCMLAFLYQCWQIDTHIRKHAEYTKVGAKVWDIVNNKRDMQINILYAFIHFGVSLLLLIALTGIK